MMVRVSAAVLAAWVAFCLAGCAGPHGERAALDNAATRPGASNYGFSGGYVGATGGGFRQ